MTYKFYNPHPEGKKVGDCVKRALTLATNKDYKTVSLELNRLKKVTGAKKFNDNNNWKEYVKLQGWEKLSFPAIAGQPRMNGHRFVENYPKGTYLLRMSKHLVTVKDGIIYDTWDCRDKCVYNAWIVK